MESKCGAKFIHGECPGDHLGKFSSCEDAALFEMAMDQGDGNGHPDYGHAAPVKVGDGETTPERWTMDADGRTVEVPAGYYIVWTQTTGAVSTTKFATENDAEIAWDGWCLAFEAWAALGN